MSTMLVVNQEGKTFARILSNSVGTLHSNQIALDKAAAIAEASSIIEEAYIQVSYDIVPKRTIDDFLQAHQADMARWPRKEYVDIDVPMMDDGGD